MITYKLISKPYRVKVIPETALFMNSEGDLISINRDNIFYAAKIEYLYNIRIIIFNNIHAFRFTEDASQLKISFRYTKNKPETNWKIIVNSFNFFNKGKTQIK